MGAVACVWVGGQESVFGGTGKAHAPGREWLGGHQWLQVPDCPVCLDL